MKRRVGMVLVGVFVVLAGWWWMRGRTDSAGSRAEGSVRVTGASRAAASAERPRVDPRTLARASISGTVTDEAKAPIANARVCAGATSWELPDAITREPACTQTDAKGGYKLADLIAADYAVHAAARQFHPGAFHPAAGSEKLEFPLAAGEARTGVDLVLHRGGVEITGVVLDISGGPIAHAQVRASRPFARRLGVAVETDEQGTFALWVDRGDIVVFARAEGYAPSQEMGSAPGRFELLMTPESSLAGTVIDAATNQPVSGARVTLERGLFARELPITELTDAQGKFRLQPLAPGRVVATATTEHGYGRTEGSTLVGLGQHVDGVIIKLFPAHRITGKIVAGKRREACRDGGVSLRDDLHARRLSSRTQDGEQVIEGVRPGTYNVWVSCEGYQARDHYAPIVVADADITGLVWEVDEGARIRGKVLTRSGQPVDGADLRARVVGGAPRDKAAWSVDRSKPDGSYELSGLKTGTYRIDLEAERGVAPRDGYTVTVAAGATVDRDLVLEDGGTLTGTVVDEAGGPVPDVDIVPESTDRSWSFALGSIRTDASGAFRIESLRPGDYRVTANRGWSSELRRPGTTDDARQGEKVTVRAGQTATVRLVVETERGTIRGAVVDAAGKPVPDAFVSSARESDAAGAARSSVADTRGGWWGDQQKPVLTQTDGRFTITKLAPGKYTLRAYRKGGGEAVAEHVEIGATAKLQIKPTGSIEGTARRDGAAPIKELKLAVRDRKTGFEREETFYMTGGRFAIADLPAGHFELTASGEGSQKMVTVDLQEAEARTGLDLVLDALLTVTGRVVEYGTKKPVPGMRVVAAAPGGTMVFMMDDSTEHISDESGRFTVRNVPRGKVVFRGLPTDFQNSELGPLAIARTLDGTGTVDVGELEVLRRRVKRGEPIGELGVRMAQQPDDTAPEDRQLKVSWIDPAGPAAKSGLQVGDVITTCDGVDVTGANGLRWFTLSRAAPGTKLSLTTQRGATVAIVLAAP